MSKFRTIELSPKGALPDGLRTITVKSPSLKGRADITVWIPPGYDPSNLPCTLLLHGVYGSHWAWTLHGEAHKTASKLIEEKRISPCILVMPSDGLWGDGSGYLEHNGYNFEQWITEDLISVVRECFQKSSIQRWGISGLSMGGYDALRLGLKHPDLFYAISAHSSITAPHQMKQFVEEPLAHYTPTNTELSLEYWIDNNSKHNIQQPLRFDCGTNDPLIQPNRELHALLKSKQCKHIYEEYSGGHTWEYWKENVCHSMKFIDSHRD